MQKVSLRHFGRFLTTVLSDLSMPLRSVSISKMCFACHPHCTPLREVTYHSRPASGSPVLTNFAFSGVGSRSW